MTHSVCVCALLGSVALAAAAHAQQDPASYNFAIQGGVGGYRSTFVRDLMGKSNTYIGLRKAAPGADPQLLQGNTTVSYDLDYLSGGKNGSSASGYGVGIVERMALGSRAGRSDRGPYVGIGLGLGRSSIKEKIRIVNGGEVAFKTISQSKTGIYFKAIVGINLGSRAFAEFGYVSYPNALGVRPASIVTSVGVKF